MQPFPHPNDASYKIWSRLANWPQRYSSFIWIMTEWQNHRMPEGQGKSSIAPTFSKWGYNDLCAQGRLSSAWASIQSDQSSLSAWRNVGSLATHWAHREGSDQTGWMPRQIWAFAGRTGDFAGFVMMRLMYLASLRKPHEANRKQLTSWWDFPSSPHSHKRFSYS